MKKQNGIHNKNSIIKVLAHLLLFTALLCNGVSYAGESPVSDSPTLAASSSASRALTSLKNLQILTEAEVVRYERLMQETRELLGGFKNVEEARERVARLTEEAERSASPEFKGHWNVSDAQAQSYNDAVKYLLNLYAVYISVLQNLQVSPIIPRLGSDRLSDTLSVIDYDELREEYERLRKGLESHRSAIKSHSDNLQMLTVEYQKQQALSASGVQNMNDSDTQAFLLLWNRLETERILVSLSAVYGRMEVELSYSQAAASTYGEMTGLLEYTRTNLRFTEEDLNSALSNIQATITELETYLPKTIDELAKIGEEISPLIQPELYASLGLGFLQRHAELYRSASESAQQAKTALLAARYASERFRRYELMSEIRVLSQMTTLWRTRYDIFTGVVSGDELWNTRSEARNVLDQIDKDEQFIYQNLQNIQSNYYIIETLSRNANKETAQILKQILVVLTEIQMHMHSKVEMTLRAQRLLAMGIEEESSEKINSLRFMQRLTRMYNDFTHVYMGRVLWRGAGYEVTTYDLTLSILTLIIGLFVSSILSRLIVRMIAYKRNIDKTFLTEIQRIIFYLFVFFCFMLAFNAINIPLTAFAFAGGAITIAAGFGAKVIFSNQISGMMIFFSRSFRHGDVIEIDGTSGVVEEIGMRATRVATYDGAEIMVPNSYFMESKIINYTKSGPMKRNIFRMRVAGDCDPKEVETILTEEIKSYRNSPKKKEPFVILADFSQRSIDFDIYYWYDCKRDNPLEIMSHFRLKVLQKLRERGIKPYDPHERIVNTGS